MENVWLKNIKKTGFVLKGKWVMLVQFPISFEAFLWKSMRLNHGPCITNPAPYQMS